jgi:hypothetical protein
VGISHAYFSGGNSIVAVLIFSAVAGLQPRPRSGPKPGGGGGAAGSGGPSALIVKTQAEQIAQLFSEAGFQSKAIENDKIHMVQTKFWNDQIFSGVIPIGCEQDGSGWVVMALKYSPI